MCGILNESIIKIVSLQPDEEKDESFTTLKVLIYINSTHRVYLIIELIFLYSKTFQTRSLLTNFSKSCSIQ